MGWFGSGNKNKAVPITALSSEDELALMEGLAKAPITMKAQADQIKALEKEVGELRTQIWNYQTDEVKVPEGAELKELKRAASVKMMSAPTPAPAAVAAPPPTVPERQDSKLAKVASAATPDHLHAGEVAVPLPERIPSGATGGPTGDVKKGAKLYKAKCAQCHTIEPMGSNKQGPCLHGIIGRAAGALNYDFSNAIKDSGIIWNDDHLNKFMINPKKYIPGTKMVFAGLKKEGERADIVAYINEACSE